MVVYLFSLFFSIFLHIFLNLIAHVNLVLICLFMSHFWSKIIIKRFLHQFIFIYISILRHNFSIKSIIIIGRRHKVFYLIRYSDLTILYSFLIVYYSFYFINVYGFTFWVRFCCRFEFYFPGLLL